MLLLFFWEMGPTTKVHVQRINLSSPNKVLGKIIRIRKTVRMGAQLVGEEVRPKEFEYRSLGRRL